MLTWLKSFVVIALGKRRYQVVYNITRQLGDKVDVDVFYLSLVHKHSAILLVDMQWQGLYTLYTIFSCCHVILRRFIHTTHSHKNGNYKKYETWATPNKHTRALVKIWIKMSHSTFFIVSCTTHLMRNLQFDHLNLRKKSWVQV